MKNIFVKCKKFVYPISAVIIILLFPSLFQKYQDYRFLCGAVASVGIAHQLYHFIKNKEKRKYHLANSTLLLLGFIMSNEFWNWEILTQVFPKLSQIPQYWAVGGILIFLVLLGILFATISLIMKYLSSIDKEANEHEYPALDEIFCTSTEIPMGHPSLVQPPLNQKASLNVMEPKGKTTRKNSLSLFFGFATIILSIGVCTYLLIKNEAALESLKLNTIMVGGKIALWGLLMICFVAFICWITVYSVGFIKFAFDDVRKGIKLGTGDKRKMYIRLVSFLIVAMLQIIFFNKDFDGWIKFLKKPDDIAPIFIGIVMFVMVFFLYNVVYKLLSALSDKSDSLWRYINTFTIDFIKKSLSILGIFFTPVIEAPNAIKKFIVEKLPKLLSSAKNFIFDGSMYKNALNRKIVLMLTTVSFVLSAISFAGTAQGIHDSIIKGSILGALGFSFAIQGIIFILNLYLPSILATVNPKRKGWLYGVYFVSVACSSFFSYIYFSQSMYKGDWVQDAQIEMADNYAPSRYELGLLADKVYQTSSSGLSNDIVEIQKGLNKDSATAEILDTNAIIANCDLTVVNDSQINKIMDTLSDASSISIANLTSSGKILEERSEYYNNANKELTKDCELLKAEILNTNTQINDVTKIRFTVTTASPAHKKYTDQIEKLERTRDKLEDDALAKQQQIEKNNKLLQLVSEISAYINAMEVQSGGVISVCITDILTTLTSGSPTPAILEDNLKIISNEILQNTGTTNYKETLARISNLGTTLSAFKAACSTKKWMDDSTEYISNAETHVKPFMTEDDIINWRSTWNSSITELKNHYESIKPYMDEHDQGAITDTSKKFSVLKRKYIIDLNQIETSINYLLGEQPTLARIGALFALYLDLIPILLNFCTTGIDSPESKMVKKFSPAFVGANVVMLFLLLSKL